MALNNHGTALGMTRQRREAVGTLTQALAIFRDLGDHSRATQVRWNRMLAGLWGRRTLGALDVPGREVGSSGVVLTWGEPPGGVWLV